MFTNVEELFADADTPVELSTKFDRFKTALTSAPNTHRGDVRLAQGDGNGQTLVKTESPDAAFQRLLGDETITKALGADVM